MGASYCRRPKQKKDVVALEDVDTGFGRNTSPTHSDATDSNHSNGGDAFSTSPSARATNRVRKRMSTAMRTNSVDDFEMNREEVFERSLRKLDDLLPHGVLRVCILGGTAFKNAESELFVKAFAKQCLKKLAGRVAFLTGGMAGCQQVFSQILGVEFGDKLIHILPKGNSSNFGVGVDVVAGDTLPERMELFANVGDFYVTVEGGPGVALEARNAYRQGAAILPIKSTGGASAGMFNFPAISLEQPAPISEEQWDAIQFGSEPERKASAVADVILEYSLRWTEDPEAAKNAFQPQPLAQLKSEMTRLLESGELQLETVTQLLAVIHAADSDHVLNANAAIESKASL